MISEQNKNPLFISTASPPQINQRMSDHGNAGPRQQQQCEVAKPTQITIRDLCHSPTAGKSLNVTPPTLNEVQSGSPAAAKHSQLDQGLTINQNSTLPSFAHILRVTEQSDEVGGAPTAQPPRPDGESQRKSIVSGAKQMPESAIVRVRKSTRKAALLEGGEPREIKPRRSGHYATRNDSILNPPVGERVVVGTWNRKDSPCANAVVAGVDSRGRVFWRVSKRDRQGNLVTVGSATSIRFEEISLCRPYIDHSFPEVRAMVDKNCRILAQARSRFVLLPRPA